MDDVRGDLTGEFAADVARMDAILRPEENLDLVRREFAGQNARAVMYYLSGMTRSIQRLMSTLCDNAVKYASDGPIVAEIRGEGKYIVLRVSNPVDEPLTKQQCDQLFDRFYRVDPSRNKRKQGGFGIGLAIASAVAEKHGGKISAAMEDNRLVFTCQLQRETRK